MLHRAMGGTRFHRAMSVMLGIASDDAFMRLLRRIEGPPTRYHESVDHYSIVAVLTVAAPARAEESLGMRYVHMGWGWEAPTLGSAFLAPAQFSWHWMSGRRSISPVIRRRVARRTRGWVASIRERVLVGLAR